MNACKTNSRNKGMRIPKICLNRQVKINANIVGIYLVNMITLWPYRICNYSERLALLYLNLKGYDTYRALVSVMHD